MTIKEESWILTGGKKPEKWLKDSCLLTGRTSTVRLFSLSVQERTTPPQLPELRTPSSVLEERRGKEERERESRSKTGQRRQEDNCIITDREREEKDKQGRKR